MQQLKMMELVMVMVLVQLRVEMDLSLNEQVMLTSMTEKEKVMKEMKENRVKPAGEWNLYEVRAQGDKITLSVNGIVVNEIGGIALRRGYIGLEAEGYEVTFRNVKLQLLD